MSPGPEADDRMMEEQPHVPEEPQDPVTPPAPATHLTSTPSLGESTPGGRPHTHKRSHSPVALPLPATAMVSTPGVATDASPRIPIPRRKAKRKSVSASNGTSPTVATKKTKIHHGRKASSNEVVLQPGKSEDAKSFLSILCHVRPQTRLPDIRHERGGAPSLC